MLQLNSVQRGEPVIRALMDAYCRSLHGRTGGGRREFSIRYCKLVHELARANVSEEKRGRAILEQLRAAGVIRWDHVPLQRNLIKTIYIPLSSEQALFGALVEAAPSSARGEAVKVVESQFNALDGHPFENEWRTVLNQARDDISNGRSAEGLPNDTALHHDILRATAAVLNNRSPILMRRLSSEKLKDSKLLKLRRDSVERFMTQFLPPDLSTLESWQVRDVPPAVLLRGPLGLRLDDGSIVEELEPCSPYTIKEEVLARAQSIFTSADRCFTIENRTTFLETAAISSGEIIIHTSYPSIVVVQLLRLLPSSVRLFHWGDTDPWGYDILRVLREKTGRPIVAWRMSYRPADGIPLTKRESAILSRLISDSLVGDMRSELIAMQESGNKGDFEQESLPITNLC